MPTSPSPSPPPGERAFLVVLGAQPPTAVGRMVRLGRGELVLGRSAEAGLQVEDEGISRKHCKVLPGADGRFQLVDLGSRHGTFLNGLRVTSAPLFDGDRIQLGAQTVLRFSLQEGLEAQFERAAYEAAVRDGLTRAYNARFFADAVQKELAHAVRHRTPLSLVLLDVDGLGRVNAAHGQAAGDYVLQRLAGRVQDTVRTEDLLARTTGGTFALLLRQAGPAEARVAAERCRHAAGRTEYVFAGTPIRVSVSLGVASLDGAAPDRTDALEAAAAAALARAKAAGGDRVDAA